MRLCLLCKDSINWNMQNGCGTHVCLCPCVSTLRIGFACQCSSAVGPETKTRWITTLTLGHGLSAKAFRVAKCDWRVDLDDAEVTYWGDLSELAYVYAPVDWCGPSQALLVLLVKGRTRPTWKAPWNTSNSLFSCFTIPGKQLGSDISSPLAASCAFSITAFLKGDSTLEVCLCRLQYRPAYYEQGQWVICSMSLQCCPPLSHCYPHHHHAKLIHDRQRKERGGGRGDSPRLSLVFRCDYPPSVLWLKLYKLILICN